MSRRLPLLSVVLLLASTIASARVISYAPYSDRISVPALGHRLNRHFGLVETRTGTAFSYDGSTYGQLVIYDTKGEEEPRAVLPAGTSEMTFNGVALREPPGEQPQILAVTTYPPTWNLSVDGGRTWKQVAVTGLLAGNYAPNKVDLGGWYARSRYANIRVGNRDYPFVAVSVSNDGYRLVAIRADGTAKQLLFSPQAIPLSLAGSDDARRRFLVRAGLDIDIVDLDGNVNTVGFITNATFGGYLEGWITAAGAAYAEVWKASNDIALWQYVNGVATFIDGTYDKTNPLAPPPQIVTTTQNPFFAVPTNDHEGAWVVKRMPGQPTRLSLHTKQRGLVEQWSDITAPEVEAIIPAPTSERILIQVHRPRRSPDSLVIAVPTDPALAIWQVGQPAPRAYDELFLTESPDKGFVHIDVDAAQRGEPFVFDGGRTIVGSGNGLSAGGGGADVVQEWGVVRGSLRQRLVLPGFGRTAGAFGSLWRSDLTLSNPNDTPTDLLLRFVPTGAQLTASATNAVRLQLGAREIRLVPDATKQLFGLDGGVGALFIEPEGGASIEATGRTYNLTDNGTFGYGMQAMDVYAAAGPRFPVTFSAAFQGPKFRTNLFLTDVSGRGTAVRMIANGPTGAVDVADIPEAIPNGVMQFNGLAFLPIGSLTITPTRGEAIASLFCVDNDTNDPTFFPPDLSAAVTRTIPVIGHLEGANGSQFRSDLFLYNDSSASKALAVEMRSWTSNDSASMFVTLSPHEARMVPDVLKTWFNRTGTARLRIANPNAGVNIGDTSIHVTSRTYTVDAKGGTYGFLMPPLNGFQMATTGDTLEILGTTLERRFRTNIGLVDVTSPTGQALPPRARIEIIGANGTLRDSFETSFQALGGTQLNDVFRARELAMDGTPVLIRITPLQGMIGAYAASLDNDTNDPMYFAANLAAK